MRSILLLRRNVFFPCIFLTCFIFFQQGVSAQVTKTVTGQAAKVLSGTVVSLSTGEPVAGASIRAKGIRTGGGTTNAKGEFRIVIPASATMLVVTSIGFKELEVPVDAVSTIRLTPTDQTLNDVVVVGYGTQKKSDINRGCFGSKR